MICTTENLVTRWLKLEETNQEGELLIHHNKIAKIMSEFETAWHNFNQFQYFKDEAEDRGEIAAFYAWCEFQGEEYANEFQDYYRGEWLDTEEYAGELINDMGILDEVPEMLKYYIDVKAFARDLELGGDIWTIESDYGVFVFSN